MASTSCEHHQWERPFPEATYVTCTNTGCEAFMPWRGDDPVDAGTQGRITEAAHAKHEPRQLSAANARRLNRERMPLDERFAAILRQANVLAAVGGGQIERAPAATDDDIGGRRPPDAETVDISQNVRAIEHHVAEIEQKVDAARGLDHEQNYRLMDRTDLNRILRDRFEGWAPEDIAVEAPYLGKPAAIRYERKEMGLRQSDGLPAMSEAEQERTLKAMADRGATVREVAVALDCSTGKAQKLLREVRGKVAA